MGDKRYFYTSAFLAIGIYVFLVLLLLVYLTNNNIKKIDAATKNTVLQLDIIMDTPKQEKQKISIKSGIKNKEIAKEVVKKTTSVSVKQRTNLKSLFANVKTKAKKVTKEKVLNVKQSTIASRFKSKFEKEQKVKDVVLSDLNNNRVTKDNQKKIITTSKNKSDSDESQAKFESELLIGWSRFLPSSLPDLESIALITWKPNGTFKYIIQKSSGNILYDEKLKDFLEIESRKTRKYLYGKKILTIRTTFGIK